MNVQKSTVIFFFALFKATSCLFPLEEDSQENKLWKSDMFFARPARSNSYNNGYNNHLIQNDLMDLYDHKNNRKVDIKSNVIYTLSLMNDDKPTRMSLMEVSHPKTSKISSRIDFEEPYSVLRNRIIPVQLHKVLKFPAKRHVGLFDAPSPIYVKSPPKATAIPVHKIDLPQLEVGKPKDLPAPMRVTTAKSYVQPTQVVTKAIFMDNPSKIMAFPIKKVLPKMFSSNKPNLFESAKLFAMPTMPTQYMLPSEGKKNKLSKYYKPIFIRNAPRIIPVPIYKVLSMPITKKKRPVSIYRTVYLHMPVKRVRAADAMALEKMQLSPTADVVVNVKPIQTRRDYLNKLPTQHKREVLNKLPTQQKREVSNKVQPCKCKTNKKPNELKPEASNKYAEQVFYSGGKCYKVNGNDYNDIDC